MPKGQKIAFRKTQAPKHHKHNLQPLVVCREMEDSQYMRSPDIVPSGVPRVPASVELTCTSIGYARNIRAVASLNRTVPSQEELAYRSNYAFFPTDTRSTPPERPREE